MTLLAYATADDLVRRFGVQELVELTDLDRLGVMDAQRVQTKLDDAHAFVDGYVGQVYALPLRGCLQPVTAVGTAPAVAAPPVLTRLVCDLARYYLHADLAPEHEVTVRFKAAVKELEALAAGKTQLACPWGGSPGELLGADAQTGTAEVFYSGQRRLTDETTRGFA